MKKFQVTVNGNTYEVDVEEITNSGAQPVVTNQQPVQYSTASVQKPATPAAPVSTEGTTVEAPMQGKIVGLKVTQNQKVQEGDVIAVLEAMKMENEIVASTAGTVVSIHVAIGQSVDAGDLIATLN
ncbi:MAG: acetyl-CoA carboxylase biotin carboxyl carrier protein subunit [Firmicutes bacterium HGW-Firmicutes-3]|jgi:biotin carboxyl carrier protein|nr:MAG: acetyl-CoA carboxylase biotin carboxyl carrier protein subunit [Firmicutes bacterium HGW-Firmicutes-5]PKM57737.1 MAG: acetyl-CoA carboxylase biotin carboxyl carrier protein subunit [Firmicutes bacterium HGW-Firmicutes-3]